MEIADPRWKNGRKKNPRYKSYNQNEVSAQRERERDDLRRKNTAGRRTNSFVSNLAELSPGSRVQRPASQRPPGPNWRRPGPKLFWVIVVPHQPNHHPRLCSISLTIVFPWAAPWSVFFVSMIQLIDTSWFLRVSYCPILAAPALRNLISRHYIIASK
ncbi:hypothetical protein ASPZODRAFT_1326529 [Penicilliopsis zonata CBS 506.65]|uniref:Uncharacterized protein n=1 Tax=Penicilliopsis zonata CBS 506.65 TaxID=1073090 RepID=A0A1L9SNX8_9EURO|nr:hypothetical protein ASPZODRAFT_1326529 [Penicilliopsis zonata CBS 506.65]OJJ48826.1 hypothetical protein ASPZODRAFT_1326529 [Penicilliopsis zonata CBS 506.65]